MKADLVPSSRRSWGNRPAGAVRTALLALVMVAGPMLAPPVAAAPAAAQSRPEPILILISIDGFRWDYLDLYPKRTRTLARMARDGVRSEGLIPVFPTKTFPNHYTIVTGLYPARHGIVGNSMWDPVFEASFSLANRAAVEDGRWWQGEPIWVTAERQGVHSATLFWPGSEAEIGGYRPSQWRVYDKDVSGESRVDQVLEWLRADPAERPRFVTLYFSDVDSAGHEYGPTAKETAAAVDRVDGFVARLVAGLDAAGLRDVVDLMIVSDHGMTELSTERVVYLEDYVNLDDLRIIARDCILFAQPREGREEAVLEALRNANPHLSVYRRDEVPERWRYAGNRRITEIIGVADEGWWIASDRESFRSRKAFPRGMHGYDPEVRSMHGLFIAHGPDFARGRVVPRFEAVHLYGLMAHVLGLEPAPNQGDLDVVRATLDVPTEVGKERGDG